MNKEFVPYVEAQELKELGFDEPCLGFYDGKGDTTLYFNNLRNASGDFEPFNNNKRLTWFGAPTYSQAFRFFREKYNILANTYSNASGFLYEWHDTIGGTHRGWSEYEGPNDSGVWDSYEEAELACLKKLIEIIKNGNK